MTEQTVSSKAFWPAKGSVVGCDPVAVAALAIKAGCDNAPHAGSMDTAFWERVHGEAERIASWAVQGLGIDGRPTEMFFHPEVE